MSTIKSMVQFASVTTFRLRVANRYNIWIWLICALKAHINYQLLEIFYEKLKKLFKKLVIFSFFHKKFPKIIY